MVMPVPVSAVVALVSVAVVSVAVVGHVAATLFCVTADVAQVGQSGNNRFPANGQVNFAHKKLLSNYNIQLTAC